MENEIKKDKISAVCIACRKDSLFPFTKKNGFDIFRCSECRMLSLNPIPGISDVKSIYDKEYFSGGGKGFGFVDYEADKEAMRSAFERYIDDFTSVLSGPGRLLDIGAANGHFMKLAGAKGWKTKGIEISSYAAGLGKSQGLDIEVGTIGGTKFPKGSFDVVTMWDVIEHLSDPALDIGQIAGMLRPGGLLAINTPDSGSMFARTLGSRWHLLVPPEHIHCFNRKSLKLFLENNGFEVIEIGCIGKRYTVEYIIHRLAHWQNLGIWKSLLGFVERNGRIGRIALPVNLRDNMYMLARKIKNS